MPVSAVVYTPAKMMGKQPVGYTMTAQMAAVPILTMMTVNK
jgi:hypothetical protein